MPVFLWGFQRWSSVLCRGALEGKGTQRRPWKRLDRRLEEVAKAVGGGYCRLQMPLRLALAVREMVAGHRLGALEGGGGGGATSPLSMHPWCCVETCRAVSVLLLPLVPSSLLIPQRCIDFALT